MNKILHSDPEAFEGDEDIIYDDYETLEKKFSYKIQPTETHDLLIKAMQDYIIHNDKFMRKKMAPPGIRARRALLIMYHLCRKRRIEISKTYGHPDWRNKHFRA